MTTKTITKKDGKTYTVRSNRDRFFYPKEWVAFYEALKPKQRKTFDCLISTGARINEIRHIQKQDVDIENKRVILRVTKIKAKKKEKNPRPRTIPFSVQYGKRLKGYFKDLEATDYLGVLSTPAANTALKLGLQRAGIEDWQMFSIHNIRKTFEVWLIALNVETIKIVAHMGHSLGVAAGSYISSDIFSHEEKMLMRKIMGDLYKPEHYGGRY